MPKTIEEVHDILDEWYDTLQVGMLLIHKGPKRSGMHPLEVWKEETVKLHEMTPELQELIRSFLQTTGVDKAEFISAAGVPDRIKVSKQL
jgi:hypothetical protein